jgi:hypothetical protein
MACGLVIKLVMSHGSLLKYPMPADVGVGFLIYVDLVAVL